MRTLGDYSNRRRLLGVGLDDHNDDLDDHNDAVGVDDDDDRLDGLVAVFGFVRLDVVGVGSILVAHDEQLRGLVDLDDDDHNHNDDNHNDEFDDDGRPLRSNDDDLDDNDLDLDLDVVDDLDLDDDAGPVWLLLSDVLRRERRRLYDDGLRSRDAGDADPIVHLDDDLDDDLDV